MNKQDALATLRRHEAALRARGVLHAALFGSVARGDNRPDSDIDILVDLDPNAVQDLYAYVGLKDFVAGLFDGRVDVVSRDALKPLLQAAVADDTLYAF